jgi:hypothetical protein
MNLTLRLTTITAIMAAITSASALETELQHGAFAVGDDGTAKPFWILAGAGLQSKAIDQGWVLHDDAASNLNATVRYYGFGVTLAGVVAVGQDKSSSYPVRRPEPSSAAEAASWEAQKMANDIAGNPYSRNLYYARENKPGELLQLNAKLDWVFQINGVYGDNGPFLQIIPKVEWNTYPNQSASPWAPGITPRRTADNEVKQDQTWVGVDLWWATPIPGIEIGASNDWNMGGIPGYRGAVGSRQFLQAAPIDWQFWQIVNFGNGEYNGYFVGQDHRGMSYSEIGGKAIVPMPFANWWGYAKANWTYWLDSENRRMLDSLNRDAGDLQLGIGIEYRMQ